MASGISLAAARLLARLQDNGPTRISDLAVAERCSQPTITNHVKRLEAAHLVDRAADPRDARAWMIKLTKTGEQQLSIDARLDRHQPRALPGHACPSATSRRCATASRRCGA